MGSLVMINDTLHISKEQGFPKELVFEKHNKKNFLAKDFEGKVFEFSAKQHLRTYQQPPVNTYLVESVDGKWLYWGLCHILEITHDYVNKTTRGKYKIIHINNVEEMKMAFSTRDRVWKNDFFGRNE